MDVSAGGAAIPPARRDAPLPGTDRVRAALVAAIEALGDDGLRDGLDGGDVAANQPADALAAHPAEVDRYCRLVVLAAGQADEPTAAALGRLADAALTEVFGDCTDAVREALAEL
jgi:hypothetical protein